MISKYRNYKDDRDVFQESGSLGCRGRSVSKISRKQTLMLLLVEQTGSHRKQKSKDGATINAMQPFVE
jgi:hypothetical protein